MKNWRRTTLGSVTAVIAGQSPEGKFYNSLGNGLPFYQGKKDFGVTFIKQPTVWTTVTTKISVAGDVLMSVRAPVGPVNFATETICIGRGLAAIRPKKELNSKFLYFFLLAKQAEISGSEGAVFSSISKNQIEEILIDFPLLEEQERIARLLEMALARIVEATRNSETCIANVSSILYSELDRAITTGLTWKQHSLGSITTFVDYRGRTPTKTHSGIPLVTAKNVRMGYIKKEPQEFVDPESYTQWMTRGIPEKGDVLFTTEAPLANVAQLETDDRVVFAQRIIVMQPNKKRLDATFLKFLLLSPTIQKQIRDKGTGATATGIKASLLKQVPLTVPESIERQQNLATKFTEISDRSEKLANLYRAKIATLEALKQSLLHQAFSGNL